MSSGRHDGADIQPALRLMTTPWSPDLVHRERIRGEVSDPNWYAKLEPAIELAKEASDETGLPQTVYRTDETCGWTHTNFAARVLGSGTLDSTWLPSYYWRI